MLSLVIIAALAAAGIGGVFAGFVDTEVSENNFVQAGIADLLVNGANDPNVPAKFPLDHVTPCKSNDLWVDIYNWGKCQGGDIYLHFKDVTSEEAGVKHHGDFDYVYDGVASGSGFLPNGVPPGYRVAAAGEPAGPNVWSSEPEKIAEVGGGRIGQYAITTTDPNLKGEDYATGIAHHLGVTVEVPRVGTSGNVLGDPDTNNDGTVDPAEYAAWVTAGNRWVNIASLTNKLFDINSHKDYLGFLGTQTMSFIHITVHLQQIQAVEWDNGGVDYDGDGDIDSDDAQLRYWPTDALQGDKATWAMLFEMVTDDPAHPEEP